MVVVYHCGFVMDLPYGKPERYGVFCATAPGRLLGAEQQKNAEKKPHVYSTTIPVPYHTIP